MQCVIATAANLYNFPGLHGS